MHSFGNRMGDYLEESRREPLSVAIVEVDRVLKTARTRQMLADWRAEDVLSPAGRKSILDETAVLSLLILQIRPGRPPLITELAKTMLQLSPRQRAVIHLTHDGHDQHLYERIWAGVQRLIALVDEFPGRRDKVLTESEYRKVVAARDPAGCRKRRIRMETLANAFVHATWMFLPEDLRDRYEGNVAIDATFVALYGKRGNSSSHNLEGDRRTANPDGGFYQREGSHGAVTHADARAMNKTDPGGKHKGRSITKLMWGVEIEIARMTPNHPGEIDHIPLLTTALGFHRPGEIKGAGLSLLKSLHCRGQKINHVIMDRAYSSAMYEEFQVPVRLLGGKLVFDYKDEDLGVTGHDPRGYVQVSGSWYLDTLPVVLREMDRTILAVRREHGESAARHAKAERLYETHTLRAKKTEVATEVPTEVPAELTITIEAARKQYGPNALALRRGEALYSKQLDRRSLYQLKAKGRMSPDGTRRYLIPNAVNSTTPLTMPPDHYSGKTVMMKLPTGKDAGKPNAGGLKHEQYYPYGAPQWKATYGMRNGVESVNRNLKRSQYEDIGNPEKRAVRGNTFTYLVIALSTVNENLRQVLSFLKRKLGRTTVTPKNAELPRTFWQSPGPAPSQNEDESQPPG